MKKFINKPELCEEQMTLGLAKAFPQYVKKLDCGNVIVRSTKKENKVALISGGGSGHEPAMAGFSISLLKLDDQTKALLDAEADTPAFKA